jgi:hypothetical protein
MTGDKLHFHGIFRAPRDLSPDDVKRFKERELVDRLVEKGMRRDKAEKIVASGAIKMTVVRVR